MRCSDVADPAGTHLQPLCKYQRRSHLPEPRWFDAGHRSYESRAAGTGRIPCRRLCALGNAIEGTIEEGDSHE
ncbi:MAG: hypothetical protein ACREN1_01645 [Candidatus Dormibacteria bacterium]